MRARFLPLLVVLASCQSVHEGATDADGGADATAGDAGIDAARVIVDAGSDANGLDTLARDAALYCPPAGECTLPSGAAGRCCDDQCVDLATDARNCGGCQSPCAIGMRCRASSCEYASCAPPAIAGAACALPSGGTGVCCDGACHASSDFRSDTSNCGACAGVCPAGQICDTYQCLHVSPLGQSCGPRAADSCPSGTACYHNNGCLPSSCAGSADGSPCISTDGHSHICCGGACVDLRADQGNCGTCGNACGPAGECVSGECYEIDPSICATPGRYASGCVLASGVLGLCCGTSCVDPLSDDANCSRCGAVCPTGTHSSGFGCVASLPDGGIADGHCSSDAQCPSGTHCDPLIAYCARHDCTGYADGSSCIASGEHMGMCCGGQCVDPRRDPHCGACGGACSSGVCALVPRTGGGPLVMCLPWSGATTDCGGAGGCPNGDPCVGGVCLSRTCTNGNDLCAATADDAHRRRNRPASRNEKYRSRTTMT